MADEKLPAQIVSIEARLRERAAEQKEFSERMDRAKQGFSILQPAIAQFRALGMSPKEVASVLLVVAEEMAEAAEWAADDP
jgi:hypothetical protein